MSLVETARRKPGLTTVIAAVVIAAAGAAVWWFGPQKLFIDQRVDQALPGTQSARDAGGAAEFDVLSEGSFRSLAHEGSGEARLVESKDGTTYLRLEDLRVENGPDLRVVLARASATSDDAAFKSGYAELAPLKGNLGDQNYRIPDDLEPSDYGSVVIWCKRFSVAFAAAPLELRSRSEEGR